MKVIMKRSEVGIARSRYIRSSAQKIRLIVNEIRGKSVSKALVILNFTNKKASKIVKKVLLSAVANANHNFSLDINNLMVVRVFVDVGPSLKRIMPRAKGRADHILKRTSHVTVVVSSNSWEKR